jgi:predicted DNA-binding transcriptional regulator YafY
MFALHAQLAAGAPIDAVRLARVLEVSTRTVKRDIECLRDSHAAPIAWDAAARTYRYTAPFDLLTGLRLDADETLALVLAGRTFAAWGNTPLGRTLTLALQKIARLDRSTTPAMVLVIELL